MVRLAATIVVTALFGGSAAALADGSASATPSPAASGSATAGAGDTGPGVLWFDYALTIPELGLREVVREGTSSGVLELGPGHRRDTPMPGQAGTVVLMARAAGYGGPFGTLDELRPDETLTLTTGQGKQLYRILDVRRAGDPVPAPVGQGKGRLVLVTASGPAFAPDGVLQVDADLISKVQESPARPLVAAQLDQSELPMHGDPSGWVPLVLWGEALLLAAVLLAWARIRWGRWQSWVVGIPVLGVLGLTVADQVVRLLPNLI